MRNICWLHLQTGWEVITASAVCFYNYCCQKGDKNYGQIFRSIQLPGKWSDHLRLIFLPQIQHSCSQTFRDFPDGGLHSCFRPLQKEGVHSARTGCGIPSLCSLEELHYSNQKEGGPLDLISLWYFTHTSFGPNISFSGSRGYHEYILIGISIYLLDDDNKSCNKLISDYQLHSLWFN